MRLKQMLASTAGFLLLGVLFHVIFVRSIFDIYFKTPLVHGMRHFNAEVEAPANRLFLVVEDGCRADKFYGKFPDAKTGVLRHYSPYLLNIAHNQGQFGVSHTRVPTESRPGHVALIAGFYEDVSSVTKGWKTNAVEFDSVFNQSTHTWSYGSPDILPMFVEGAPAGHVEAHTYSAYIQDFATAGSKLDIWVFDRFEELFAKAESDPELNAKLRQKGNVFFLHLLGVDITGHGKRPYSQDYIDNIELNDQYMSKFVPRIESFFGDNRTAWIVTADHGMSDYGSHGDGHPDNTRTPIVAWGAGIAGPEKGSDGHDKFSEDWDLGDRVRKDINQADIAPLMSYLVGINYPANNVGLLPSEYLSASLRDKSVAVFNNARQILEQYIVKSNQKQKSQMFFHPFKFSSVDHQPESLLANIESLIKQERFQDAFHESIRTVDEALAALKYLQTYDRLFLRCLISCGYVGWMVFVSLYICKNFVAASLNDSGMETSNSSQLGTKADSIKNELESFELPKQILHTITASLLAYLSAQRSSAYYYLYALFTMYFWYQVVDLALELNSYLNKVDIRRSRVALITNIAIAVFYILILEVVVAAYFERRLFSLCLLGLSIWPLSLGSEFVMKHKLIVFGWIVACLSLAGTMLLSPEKKESIVMISVSTALTLLIGMIYFAVSSTQRRRLSSLGLSVIQTGLTAAAYFSTAHTILSLGHNKGLPLANQITNWTILILSIAVPLWSILHQKHEPIERLIILFGMFAPLFIILTISYEGLFYLAFCLLLVVWLQLEQALRDKSPIDAIQSSDSKEEITQARRSRRLKDRKEKEEITVSEEESGHTLSFSDLRTAMLLFFFIQVAFFGTGNVASISAFSLDAVNRLTSVFAPFLMATLLIFKIIVPFVLLSVTSNILSQVLKLPLSSLSMMVFGFSDIVTLNFFYLVKDEGSWLDIGCSISHFSISSAMMIVLFLMEHSSFLFTRNLQYESELNADRKVTNGNGVKAT